MSEITASPLGDVGLIVNVEGDVVLKVFDHLRSANIDTLSRARSKSKAKKELTDRITSVPKWSFLEDWPCSPLPRATPGLLRLHLNRSCSRWTNR